ncbi:MAG: hypothetical protein NC177_13235 [Ruminococcus flavefaciens]|nr:hypothetical protein [Ruminococcus flavefaciens]
MSINLNKEKINENKETTVFSDENFENINLNNIMENKRIFIPYDELPDSEEMRYSYLESLVSFIERKTEKHCSYFPVNETEPYEVSGFYIQTATELKDRNGVYVSNNDFVYDKNGVKWHVTYYYKNNQLCILIDNDSSGYVVVSGLSDFSLNPDDDFDDDDLDLVGEISDDKKTPDKISIAKIALLVIVCVIAIILLIYSLIYLDNFITEFSENLFKEMEKTESNELSPLTEMNKLIKEMLIMLFRIWAIIIPFITIRQIIKNHFRR